MNAATKLTTITPADDDYTTLDTEIFTTERCGSFMAPNLNASAPFQSEQSNISWHHLPRAIQSGNMDDEERQQQQQHQQQQQTHTNAHDGSRPLEATTTFTPITPVSIMPPPTQRRIRRKTSDIQRSDLNQTPQKEIPHDAPEDGPVVTVTVTCNQLANPVAALSILYPCKSSGRQEKVHSIDIKNADIAGGSDDDDDGEISGITGDDDRGQSCYRVQSCSTTYAPGKGHTKKKLLNNNQPIDIRSSNSVETTPTAFRASENLQDFVPGISVAMFLTAVQMLNIPIFVSNNSNAMVFETAPLFNSSIPAPATISPTVPPSTEVGRCNNEQRGLLIVGLIIFSIEVFITTLYPAQSHPALKESTDLIVQTEDSFRSLSRKKAEKKRDVQGLRCRAMQK